MIINKDTLIFGSFSKKAGNVGCLFFNTEFKKRDINAIYKSFSVESIEQAVSAAKCLKFSGFAVSMPFKIEVIQYLDLIDASVTKTGACNTVIIRDSKLHGYNTDYKSIIEFILKYKKPIKFLHILGNGGYSKTVQACCQELDIPFNLITRDTWNIIASIHDSIIFNCTPLEKIDINHTNDYIDCINTTETGGILARRQAEHQLELYIEWKGVEGDKSGIVVDARR